MFYILKCLCGLVLLERTKKEAELNEIDFFASGALSPKESLMPSLMPTFQERPWSACHRPWRLIYITVHGNVLPCCFAPWVAEHYDEIILGNIFKQSLEEIWYGTKYQIFRDALMSSCPPDTCKSCGVKWSL